jgi:hypothetical protein
MWIFEGLFFGDKRAIITSLCYPDWQVRVDQDYPFCLTRGVDG